MGAGLVGCTLAIALKRRGEDVILFEKRSDMRKDSADAGRSINLIVTAKGLNAFKNLNLINEVLSITTPVYGRMMHSREGELTYQPYGKEEECNYSISRGELNKLLLNEAEKAGVEIRFEHELEKVDEKNKTVLFKNGASEQYQVIYGCDGAGSPTRKELIRLDDRAEDYIQELDADYIEMDMPAKNGEYAIDKKSLHIWPRTTHMLMALPNQGGSFTMTLYMHRHDKGNAPSFETIKTKEDITTLFEKDFKDAIPDMPNFATEYVKNPQGFLGTLRCNKWYYKDQIVLLGDAAHAVVPFFGQGMNCGVEDITYLLESLDNFDNLEESFEDYDQRQRPNGHAIADMAIENYVEMSEKVGDERFLLKKQIAHKIETTWPDLYRSRYGMVVYTLIPYSLCQKAGLIQNEILDELSNGIESVEQLDLDKAKQLLDNRFTPFIKEHALDLSRFAI
jgi:kynurenine 3-monooxygenase